MSPARQHTPGPWVTGGCGEDGWHMILGPKTRFYHAFGEAHATSIAYVSVSDSEAEDLANARLIAAAPDLLEALEAAENLAEGAVKLLRQLDMETGRIAAECVLRDARAAIAKATATK